MSTVNIRINAKIGSFSIDLFRVTSKKVDFFRKKFRSDCFNEKFRAKQLLSGNPSLECSVRLSELPLKKQGVHVR